MGRRRAHPRLTKASDVLADRLRRQILGHGMQPGDPLPAEAALIEEHGFSRGTVREALRLLEADGLIEIRRGPNGGIRVARPDLSQVTRSLALLLTLSGTSMRTFSEFRLLIEPAAAAAAARSATEEQRGWLLSLAESGAVRTPPWEPSVEFHEGLGVCSNNDLLRMIIALFSHELTWHVPGENLSEQDLADTRRAHRGIALAVAAGDPERAAAAMTRHLRQFERVLGANGRLDQPVVPKERWLDV
ncbi:FadR/GntR family transcriptional regulator [Pseudonocardia sp. WMMC193]|uniref:FadR/GntR family transcriptional regulator n=1 Tax=Pseudonocardia sp. WMMC193 TaxID=2911965 RepID=UPI001EFF6797|nr:GntR family transcriptional regulator [Pseudonocardia sp. WMMC193]MCF7550787.1 GntR family transcriptional regulator [Pseudonocardia sp. WMMC193]